MNYFPVKFFLFLSLLLAVGCGKHTLPLETKNPDGILFTYEKCEFKESKEPHSKSKSVRFIRFKAENVPENKTFQLLAVGMDNTQHDLGEFQMKDGRLRDKKDDRIFEECNVVMLARKGEVFKVYLIATDGTTCVNTTIIPQSLEVIAKDGAKIGIALMDQDATVFCVAAAGFEKGESLKLHTDSCGEIITTSLTADQSGNFSTFLLPAVIGKKGGDL